MIIEMESVHKGSAKVHQARMDNGKEHLSKELNHWFREKGINPEFSPPYHQSTMIERTVKTKNYWIKQGK